MLAPPIAAITCAIWCACLASGAIGRGAFGPLIAAGVLAVAAYGLLQQRVWARWLGLALGWAAVASFFDLLSIGGPKAAVGLWSPGLALLTVLLLPDVKCAFEDGPARSMKGWMPFTIARHAGIVAAASVMANTTMGSAPGGQLWAMIAVVSLAWLAQGRTIGLLLACSLAFAAPHATELASFAERPLAAALTVLAVVLGGFVAAIWAGPMARFIRA